MWVPQRLRQTFEALLNIFAIAEASLEKSVHQTCALPGHPAALYFIKFFFFFFASEIGCKVHLQFNLPQVSVLGTIVTMFLVKISYVPGRVLKVLPAFSHLIPVSTLGGRYFYFYVSDEETEA